MKSLWPRTFASLVGAALLVAGCGPEDLRIGIDGTGVKSTRDVVAYGRSTGGTDLRVNGAVYTPTGAEVMIDGRSASLSEISAGDIVMIEGKQDLASLQRVATLVTADHVLVGQVSSTSPGEGFLVAFGQTVRISDETVIDASIPGGIASLQSLDLIKVSGYRDVQGEIHATRISRFIAGAIAVTHRTIGAITMLDASNHRFAINGLVVNYASAEMAADLVHLLAPRLHVEVEGTGFTDAGELIASAVKPRRQIRHDGAGKLADIEGYVTRITVAGTGQIAVDGLPVELTTATAGIESLNTGSSVRVMGGVESDGSVVATTVSISGIAPPPATGAAASGTVFDAMSGPVADAMVDMWINTGSFSYSLTWARQGSFLRTAGDGSFTVPMGTSWTANIYAVKAGFVQPCAVLVGPSNPGPVQVELVAVASLQAPGYPGPVSAAGATTATGTVYEQTATGPQPVAGALVWFGDSMGITVATTITDSQGRYLACNLPNDPAWRWPTDVWVSKSGYADTVVERLDTSGSFTLDLQLSRTP